MVNDAREIFAARTVALTTYRRDGTPVSTPVNVAATATGGVIKTWTMAGKVKRIRHTARATLAPCTVRGIPTGEPVEVVARLLSLEQFGEARRLLRAKHPVLHGVVVPLGHRLRRLSATYIEVTLVEPETTRAPTP